MILAAAEAGGLEGRCRPRTRGRRPAGPVRKIRPSAASNTRGAPAPRVRLAAAHGRFPRPWHGDAGQRGRRDAAGTKGAAEDQQARCGRPGGAPPRAARAETGGPAAIRSTRRLSWTRQRRTQCPEPGDSSRISPRPQRRRRPMAATAFRAISPFMLGGCLVASQRNGPARRLPGTSCWRLLRRRAQHGHLPLSCGARRSPYETAGIPRRLRHG